MTKQPTDLDAARPPDLLVSEKFVSLQGEGLSCGAPAAFLRLARCNLRCSWCDTSYSWDFDRYSLLNETRDESIEELGEWIVAQRTGRLVVTGGEPLIQQKPLGLLLSRLRELGDSVEVVEVETNGTITPDRDLVHLVNQWNVSPKLSSSGEPETRRLRNKVLRWFAESAQANFKFVVGTEEEVSEAMAIVADLGVSGGRVLLMPRASTLEHARKLSPEVARWALARRVRFSPRLHLELYGGQRGT